MFGRFATGVAVITSAASAASGGMTANALCSLSLDPLLALVCFENNARTLGIVREAGRFGVNVLGADQEDVAEVFASKMPEAEKLEAVAHRYEAEVPIIDGALSWVACTLRELIAGGDHTIAIGEVVAMGLGGGDPLLWYARALPRRGARGRTLIFWVSLRSTSVGPLRRASMPGPGWSLIPRRSRADRALTAGTWRGAGRGRPRRPGGSNGGA